jgi:carbonic anhydrase
MFKILATALIIVEAVAIQFEEEQFEIEHPDKHHKHHDAAHQSKEEHPSKHHKHPMRAVHLASDVEVDGNATKKTSKKNVMKHASKKHKAKKENEQTTCWSYENTKHWETAFPTCRKGDQSPIALSTSCNANEVGCTPSSQPLAQHMSFSPVAGAYLSNNGHFIELVAPAQFSTVKLGKLSWSSSRIQFHTPSEHTMNGERYPAEMQILYKPVGGDNKWTLVTSVFIKEGYNKNALLSSIGFDMLNLPRTEGDKMYLSSPVDLTDGLKSPLDGGFAGYEGTLTSPPCTKDTLWFIAENTMEASATQIGNLERRFPEGNNRPLFPIGSRMIYRDFNQWSSHASGWSLISLSTCMLLLAATY